jgi:hypothetical protein
MRKRLITPIPQDAPPLDEGWLDLDRSHFSFFLSYGRNTKAGARTATIRNPSELSRPERLGEIRFAPAEVVPKVMWATTILFFFNPSVS